jgi:hypothetical protein
MLKSNDTKCVMVVFAVIGLIMICLMINSFKFIDLCYFLLVIYTACRYLILSKE